MHLYFTLFVPRGSPLYTTYHFHPVLPLDLHHHTQRRYLLSSNFHLNISVDIFEPEKKGNIRYCIKLEGGSGEGKKVGRGGGLGEREMREGGGLGEGEMREGEG